MNEPFASDPDPNYLNMLGMKKKWKVVPYTLDGAGALADLALVVAFAGKKPRIEFLGIISHTADINQTFYFEDTNGTILTGCVASPGFVHNLGADTLNTQLTGYKMAGVDAGFGIQCDIASGPAGGVGFLEFFYWYED